MSTDQLSRTNMNHIHATYSGRLQRYLLRLTHGDRELAEDLLQDTMLRVWRKIDQVPTGLDDLGPWLFTVAKKHRSETSSWPRTNRRGRSSRHRVTVAVHADAGHRNTRRGGQRAGNLDRIACRQGQSRQGDDLPEQNASDHSTPTAAADEFHGGTLMAPDRGWVSQRTQGGPRPRPNSWVWLSQSWVAAGPSIPTPPRSGCARPAFRRCG
jgi:DNA-directed RNA polymerase specialized sigma24 family protein